MLIGLRLQQLDELPLELCLRLVASLRCAIRDELGYDRAFGARLQSVRSGSPSPPSSRCLTEGEKSIAVPLVLLAAGVQLGRQTEREVVHVRAELVKDLDDSILIRT